MKIAYDSRIYAVSKFFSQVIDYTDYSELTDLLSETGILTLT